MASGTPIGVPDGSGFEVPLKVVLYVDDALLAGLPPGSSNVEIWPCRASFGTRTAKITFELTDGSPRTYFLKVMQGENGKETVTSEFLSMTEIYTAVPHLAPAPVAYGVYNSDPKTYFFLYEFIETIKLSPRTMSLPAKIAEFHSKSLAPNGTFGFRINQFLGSHPKNVSWTETWEQSFSRDFARLYELERISQGIDREMELLMKAIRTKVIPRLLLPLERTGHRIQPCLVHGELWDGNTYITVGTGQPVIFDASVFYGHNEYDLGRWSSSHSQFGGERYIKQYHYYFPPSEPTADQRDRNILYCIRFEMCLSVLHGGNLQFRKTMVEKMKYLVEKYPDGFKSYLETLRNNTSVSAVTEAPREVVRGGWVPYKK